MTYEGAHTRFSAGCLVSQASLNVNAIRVMTEVNRKTRVMTELDRNGDFAHL